MNVLLVDDQKAIVESLKNGIRWDMAGADQVYTSCSAGEARLVLVNFSVDLLITDIEMPEENGIALAEWARERFPDMEIVFLTSHPNFNYAQQAVKLRIFDYILQPVRYTAVEETVSRVREALRQKKDLRKLKKEYDLVRQNRNAIFDSLMIKCMGKREKDADEIWHRIRSFQTDEGTEQDIYVEMVRPQYWMRIEDKWDDSLLSLVFSNVLEELFSQAGCRAAVANVVPGKFWIFLMVKKGSLDRETLEDGNKAFEQFMEEHSVFHVSIYVRTKALDDDIVSAAEALEAMDAANNSRVCGIFFDDDSEGKETGTDVVAQIISYVRENAARNTWDRVSRAESAEYVHMNPEYMSRIFRERTGKTFKDFVLEEKMRQAEKLLANTGLSVGIIASKVGFDNFSHFSGMFRRYYDCNPLEYRKKKQNERDRV